MEDLGPLPRIHPREVLVEEARRDLSSALLEWEKGHDNLTTAEHIKVVTGVFNDHILSMMKFAIRHERHGDPDKPGGLE